MSELKIKRNSLISRNKNFEERKVKIWQLYSELYEVKRLRKDDCITQIAERFCLSEGRVKKLIGTKFKSSRTNKYFLS